MRISEETNEKVYTVEIEMFDSWEHIPQDKQDVLHICQQREDAERLRLFELAEYIGYTVSWRNYEMGSKFRNSVYDLMKSIANGEPFDIISFFSQVYNNAKGDDDQERIEALGEMLHDPNSLESTDPIELVDKFLRVLASSTVDEDYRLIDDYPIVTVKTRSYSVPVF